VFLGYASRRGQALIDRRLYLPQKWTADTARCEQAQIPKGISFATKPQIARELLSDAFDAGMPCAWVLADAVYGSDKHLRIMLERRGKHYILAIRSNERLMSHHDLQSCLPQQLNQRKSSRATYDFFNKIEVKRTCRVFLAPTPIAPTPINNASSCRPKSPLSPRR
jgi:hypothetical protein